MFNFLGFTRDQFTTVIKFGLLYTNYIGLGSLGLTIARAIANSILDTNNKLLQKLTSFLYTIFFSIIAATIFFGSTVSNMSVY